jgi:subfamily B ATP-binding cassette protein MsbA
LSTPTEEPEAQPSAGSPAPASRAQALRALRRLLALSREDGGQLLLVIALGAVVAAAAFVRVYLIQPLLDDIVLPRTASDLESDELWTLLRPIAWIVGATLIVSPLAVLGRSYLAEWVAGRVRQRVDIAIARKLLHVPLRTFREGSSGDFLSRSMADAQIACQMVVLFYKDVILHAEMIGIGVAMMLWISVPLTLVVLLGVPPFYLLVSTFMGRILDVSTRRQETQGKLSDRLIAILSGIKVIKAFRGEDAETAAYDHETDKYFRRHMKVMKNGALVKASGEAIWPLLFAGVIGIGGYAVVHGIDGLTIGDVMAFGAILGLAYKPLRSLIQTVPRLFEAASSAARLFSVLDMEEEVPDRPDARPMTGLREHIRFRDVAFDYGGTPVLDGIDLEVRAGEVVAIVGRTGTGKSTLVDLVLRFHDPTRGAIEIDGVDLRDLERASFLDHVALVTQEPFLFDESLMENIRSGRPDASDDEVRAAAEAASAHAFIEGLPEGYDTMAGEFGLRLSGGQRQRVTIARAILADASILVFDEATSALDAQTERAVQAAIDGLRGERTIFLVAHRLSTIQHADRIVVLEDGRIAETGDHATLLERGGVYAELIGAQAAIAS